MNGPLTITRFKRLVKFDAQNPLSLSPNGDRYLVELLDIEENVEVLGPTGQMTKIVIPQVAAPTRNPQGQLEPGVEKELTRGWRAGLVLKVGNGHRLNTPDDWSIIPGTTTQEQLDAIKGGGEAPPPGSFCITDKVTVFYKQSTVTMFFAPGDIVLIERLTGREVVLQGKRYAIVNQEDVLAKFDGTTLQDIEVTE